MTSQTALERIEQASLEYRLKTYGRTDVDFYGRPLLSKEEKQKLSELKNLPNYSLKTVCRLAGAE